MLRGKGILQPTNGTKYGCFFKHDFLQKEPQRDPAC